MIELYELNWTPATTPLLNCGCLKEEWNALSTASLGRMWDFVPEKNFTALSWRSWTAFKTVCQRLLLQKFSLFLFSWFQNNRYRSFINKQTTNVSFQIKTNWRLCTVMTRLTHITPRSQDHLGWELNPAPCQHSNPTSVTQNSETRASLGNAYPGHLPKCSDQNKALCAGSLLFSHLCERGQPQIKVLIQIKVASSPQVTFLLAWP